MTANQTGDEERNGAPARRVRAVPKQRNGMFALGIASVAVLIFVIVLGLATLFHYAEAHHALAAAL